MKMVTEHKKLSEVFPEKAAEFAQRLHIKKDEIPFVKKYYTAEKDKTEVKKSERAVISYISTGIKDRDGERLLPEGAMLDNYLKNPIVPGFHDYRSIPPAKNMWIKRDEKGLIAKTVFAKNQRSDEYYKAYTEDVGGTGPLLNAFSVGFIPIDWEDTDQKALEKDPDLPKRTYNKWELLEYSLVPIPSCPEALTIAVEKGLISESFQKELEIWVVKDAEEKEIEVEKDEPITVLGRPVVEINSKDFFVELEKDGVITKPETTENYHRIPVNTGCKVTATITISAKEGIKALYCGKEKKIHTYLFDVNKWTMEEAQAWVKEHKPKYHERWNKSFSKLFDIASAESSAPMRFHYDLYEKFLECKVKEVFQNGYSIPSPLLGSYLAGFKEILGEFSLKDTRKFAWDGSEVPPNYEVINLNSEKTDDFLVDGMQFYEAEKRPLIVNYSPEWFGMKITLTTSIENRDWNKDFLDKVHAWVKENNFLRGEKFALSGEFLKEPGDNWDNLILESKYKDSIITSAKALEKKGESLVGRGLLFIGPPGTGKTKTGRVLMNELDATFIWVSSRDFRYIGPLKALALGFSMARDLAPSVLFLEDIDTWLRGDMEFVTDLLKTEMDGIKQNKGMITIMTSNYPEKLPSALLDRPGRFHHIVNFELPGKEQRKEMISLWAGNIDEKLLDDIVSKTEGFSGAHLKELVEFAKMIAEEEEVEIGDAMLRSLDKLMEQRELIEEIRANKEDAKAVWGRVEYKDGEIGVKKDRELEIETKQKKYKCECVKCGHKLTSEKHCKDIKCPECGGTMRRVERPGPGQDGGEGGGSSPGAVASDVESEIIEFKDAIEHIREQYEKLLQEKDEHIADLKEGRVLSRKNRKIVKDAVTALNAVLKADSAGTQEDEDSESGGTVTEREIEIEKGDEQGFSQADIIRLIREEFSESAMIEAIGRAFKENLDPEKIKKDIKEEARLALQEHRGKVE